MLLERLFFTGNQNFFIIFDTLAVQIKKMSTLLHTSVTDGDSHIRLHLKEMVELEQLTADQIRALFSELGRNLITPFDREDIHFLATGLHSIARNMLHVTKQIRNYNIEGSEGVTGIVAKHNDEVIEQLAAILKKLKNIKELAKLAGTCKEIHNVLYHCDDLLDKTMDRLLKEEQNEIEIIKMMDHYESLQKMLARVGDTINVCESIIIKYS